MCLRVIASSAPNGSSISKTFGSTASARAICRRWRMPPDNSDGNLVRWVSSPVMRKYLSMIGCQSAFGIFRTRNPKRTFSSTVSQGSSADPASWKNITRSRPAPVIGVSPTSRCPRLRAQSRREY